MPINMNEEDYLNQAALEEARNKAAREAVTNPPCAFCGEASFETCTNCMATHYCSKSCQVHLRSQSWGN